MPTSRRNRRRSDDDDSNESSSDGYSDYSSEGRDSDQGSYTSENDSDGEHSMEEEEGDSDSSLSLGSSQGSDSEVSSLGLGGDGDFDEDSEAGDSKVSIFIDSNSQPAQKGGMKHRTKARTRYDSDSSDYSESESEWSDGSDEKQYSKPHKGWRGVVQRIKRITVPLTSKLWDLPIVREGRNQFTSLTEGSFQQFSNDWKSVKESLGGKGRNKQSINLKWYNGLQQSQKKSVQRVGGVVMGALLLVLMLLGSVGMQVMDSRRWAAGGAKKELFDPRWLSTRSLNYTDLLDLVHVYRDEPYNDSSFYTIKVKNRQALGRPKYITMDESDLIQISRPAVKKKRPDDPRAVRTFGCLRDGCRGLAIEDLLDRGWQMRFRAAQNNDTYKNINYRVTFLLTDTTQLNHMKKVRPDLYKNIYNDYEGKCYLTAFDGADAIGGNKGMQLKIKEKFVRKYGCKLNDLAITPSSYRLYNFEECKDLSRVDGSGITWLLKPETGSQGQGITFHTDIPSVMRKVPQFFPCKEKSEWKATERYLVQEYIEKPLLLKKSKFDVRVYMLIASSSPFLLFYHEGYLRRALAEYHALSKDRRVYLTNTHFQSKSKDFKLSDHIWPFPMMQDHLRDHGRTGGHYVETMLNPYIKKVLLFIFHSAREKLKKRHGTFHIFGIDFMIDANYHVWFIEANGYPGYTWSINFDTRNMVEEQFNLVQQVHENPRFFTVMEPGDRFGHFEMLFNELYEERTQKMYNPCEEFKYNRGYSAPLREANKRFAKYSGAGGRTDGFKLLTPTIKGAEYLGGRLHDSVTSLRNYFSKNSCDLNDAKVIPRTYLMYDTKDCELFFQENQDSKGLWIVKPVDGPGDGKGFEIVRGAEEIKKRSNLGTCRERQPDFVIQQYIGRRATFDNKFWDLQVYMLIASTKPFMVFYHHGAVRSVRPINGAAPESDSVEGEDAEGVGTQKEVAEVTESAVEPVNAIGVVGGFGIEAAVQPGAQGGGGVELNPLQEEIEEEWSPPEKELNSGTTLKFGEFHWTFDKFQEWAARNDQLGSKYVTSVFDTYAKKVARLVFESARENLARRNETYQMVSLNFMLDSKYNIHFLGARNIIPDTIPNVEVLQEHKANMMENMAGLILEFQDMPAAFARMRRGDSYGNWRMVFSEMEEKQLQLKFNPCDEFQRKLMVPKGSLRKNAWLHNYAEKKHAGNKRELRKYIDKKWRESCRGRASKELQASCIRNTISYRYKIYLEKEGAEYQDGFVDMTIRDLQNKAAAQAAG